MADGGRFDPGLTGVFGQTVMVTGAGGSVGQALCTQLVEGGVATLILYELNEFALFKVQSLLETQVAKTGTQLVPVIGCVTNQTLLAQVLNAHQPDLVVHAAALKHVPVVERNEVAGARVNTIGTLCTARAACAAGVGRFVLISTDKAVQPASVMGATKRAAETIVNDLNRRFSATRLSSVRFGNVFGSSGSVVPVFADQIARGGPVTVTDPGMTRYFMTSRQAVRLVLRAAAIAQGGEVFVLEMGHPVRILDLARGMIGARGLSVLEPGQRQNGDGGIEIIVTGKRQGEKMEEMLWESGCQPIPTGQEGILKLTPPGIGTLRLAALIDEMMGAIASENPAQIRAVLQNWTGADSAEQISLPVHSAEARVTAA